ncbi:MAG: hypothetical protein H0T99_06310 [Geodermatophilaceae bacterium]|nr:hypothetical protein [Geodermatophilaceae bacterium]MDQ3475333.1 hypothetical protein [Actinomycetota bacterium]
MTDPSRYPNSGDDAAVEPAGDSGDGVPRWVKVSAIVALIVVLMVTVMLLLNVGGGEHGPSRHSGSGDSVVPSSLLSWTGFDISL